MRLGSEQRRSPRYQKQHPVTVVLTDSTGHSMRHPAEIIDVSAEGAALRCTYQLTECSELVLDFSSQNDPEPVRVTAVVRHRHGDTYGIEFQPRSEHECNSLDWIDGLLLASGFQIDYSNPGSQSGRYGVLFAVLVAGVLLGAFLGSLLQSTVLGVSTGGVIGLVMAFAACTV
jgi:hypothetical protein